MELWQMFEENYTINKDDFLEYVEIFLKDNKEYRFLLTLFYLKGDMYRQQIIEIEDTKVELTDHTVRRGLQLLYYLGLITVKNNIGNATVYGTSPLGNEVIDNLRRKKKGVKK